MGVWQIGVEAADRRYGFRPGLRAKTRAPVFVPPLLRQEEGTELEVKTETEKDKDNPLSSLFGRLTKWIPGDTLAVYVPAVTFFAASGGQPSVGLLILMLAATPGFVLLAAWSTGKPFTKRVWWSAGIGAVAFLIWSTSVPLSGWQQWSVVAANKGTFAVVAVVVGIGFCYFAEGILKRVAG